uniref:Flagellin C-terminal domain-containing protein n=1 Tax=Desulfatirhabdium butyrativorans TaxID=340467 RepID=A0A7C4MKV9_9BACT
MTTQEFSIDMNNVGTGTNYQASNVTINGVQLDLSAATIDTLDEVVTAINNLNTGVRATVNETTGKLVLTSASGLDIKLYDDEGVFGNASTNTSTYTGTITLTSETGADVIIGGNNEAYAGFVEQGGSSEAVGSGLSLMSIANANNAIQRIDEALNKVSKNRGELGAVQNRLDSTISNLMNVSENLSAANGRIVDADFAKETADMTKAQILSQAGVAMLAQAKQLPQQVLQLLQG